jgi:hypothetical protein
MTSSSARQRRLVTVAVLTAFLAASCTSTRSRDLVASGGRSTLARTSATPAGPDSPSASRAASIDNARGQGVAAPGRVIGPWNATTVGGPAGHAIPLAGTASSLYVRNGRDLLRIDAASGRVEATRPMPDTFTTVVIAGGLAWVVRTSTSAGRLTLPGLDLRTLQPVADIRLPLAARPGRPIAVAADAHHRRLYVGVGDTVFVVGASRGRIVARYHLPQRFISSIAITPDQSRLYATTLDVSNGQASALIALDATTGRPVADSVRFDGGTTAFAATVAGVWLANGSGHTLALTFHPADDLAEIGRHPVTSAGGGFGVDGIVDDNAVWIGGSTELACADPGTGRIRARSRVPSPHHYAADINFLVPAGRRLFGYYLADAGPTSLLIRLSPPAACR